MIRSRHDDDRDGRMELTWYYDENEKPFKGEKDQDGDGNVDLWIFHQGGRLEHIELDTDRNGKADVWVYYDEQEKAVSRKRDLDHDGKPDTMERLNSE